MGWVPFSVMGVGVAAFVGVALLSDSARARPEFPQILADTVHMPCVPQCVVCHNDNDGGYGTLRKLHHSGAPDTPGFAMNLVAISPMLGNGGDYLNGGDVNSLAPVLRDAANFTPAPDVDGDGKPDLVELASGDDPNDPTPGAKVACNSEGPTYGCGGEARVARQGPIDNVAAAVSAVVALAGISVIRRRRDA
jgi:hypothetical protein